MKTLSIIVLMLPVITGASQGINYEWIGVRLFRPPLHPLSVTDRTFSVAVVDLGACLQQVPGIPTCTVTMKKYITLALLLLPTFFTLSLHAQTDERHLHNYFDSVRAGVVTPIPRVDPATITKIIKPYLTDSAEIVRIRSREVLFGVAGKSESLTVRSRAIEHLLGAANPNDVVVAGITIQMLRAFNKSDFTDSAKAHVRRLVKAEGPHLQDWMKVAGFLELKDLENNIRAYAQAGNQQAIRWAALLSLARMGDNSAATEVLLRAKKLGVNDNVVYKIFPDLVFTRDHATTSYMVEVLHQDANNCLSADAERESSIPCGYRIMEHLAPVVEGFPLKINESGDLDVGDYASALYTVRQWFLTHKNYSLSKERY